MSISTCALREEGDRLLKAQKEGELYISIHALREEGDIPCWTRVTALSVFLSTPSARRATARREPLKGAANISIHALREEGDAIRDVLELCVVGISIHALREEGDKTAFTSSIFGGTFLSTPSSRRATHDLEDERRALKFLSTPSARRATKLGTKPLTDEEIFLSTPSARRATLSLDTRRRKPRNFYPRPPRGGRREIYIQYRTGKIFLSTPSARRATCKPVAMPPEQIISIHALREEGDAMNLDAASHTG